MDNIYKVIIFNITLVSQTFQFLRNKLGHVNISNKELYNNYMVL